MVYREVSVIEVHEALRAWLAGKSERAVAAQAGVDRKTGKRYVMATVAAGLSRGGGEEQLTDELIGQVVSVVRPVRPDGHGLGWAELEARQQQIAGWVERGVLISWSRRYTFTRCSSRAARIAAGACRYTAAPAERYQVPYWAEVKRRLIWAAGHAERRAPVRVPVLHHDHARRLRRVDAGQHPV
jgi:hypothetical protein